MSTANRGKVLEDAVLAGCSYYGNLRRAFIRKRHALQHRSGVWISKGDVDFSGRVVAQIGDSRSSTPFLAECKETHETALPLSKLEERSHQLAKLAEAAADGCVSGLIIGFQPGLHAWWIPWAGELAKFLESPWRRSISQNMAAAWGLLLPLGASPKGLPLVKFLDGIVSPDREKAIEAVHFDRTANPLELPLGDSFVGDVPGEWKPRRRRAQELPPPKTRIEAELRERAGGLDPFHPEALRRFAKKQRGRGR